MHRLAGTIPALGAAAIALAIGVSYLSIIAGQGDLCAPVAWLVAAYILGAGGLAIATLVLRSRRTSCLAAAAGMLTFVGIAGMFTIGLPLLLAAGLATIAAVRASRIEHASVAAAAGLAGLLMLAGTGALIGLIALTR